MPSRERWDAMWRELGAARVAPALYDEVLAHYAEPQRHYHTAQHLDECFAQLDGARALAERPAEVELALWFHDAIYEPRHNDNEAKSADWARESALAAGVAQDAAARVHSLVMATRHEAVPQGRDQEVLVDVDLSILGARAERFDEYERQVREEYSWVPGFVFRRKRKGILEQFLARAHLFSTAAFSERLEAPARANLARSIAQL
jgi:predicted metal-dependent HD superfamily phosphohydrolase